MLVHTILGEWIGIFKERAIKLLISSFFTLLIIAFAGTSITQSEEARNPQAEDIFHRFLSAFTNSDVDGIVNLFSEDAIFWGTGSAELVEDTAGIRLYFSGLSKPPFGQALARAQNFSIMELSSDSVLISGIWEVVPQGQNTGTPLRISMALSLQDGIWKIVQFHNSAMPGS
ncbi:MAG: nuclear transport factor 2 family protein [Proteobacteria bacterium]|nr:nuclear transport factor 2 family protein [Pseudomonadota bacterium]